MRPECPPALVRPPLPARSRRCEAGSAPRGRGAADTPRRRRQSCRWVRAPATGGLPGRDEPRWCRRGAVRAAGRRQANPVSPLRELLVSWSWGAHPPRERPRPRLRAAERQLRGEPVGRAAAEARVHQHEVQVVAHVAAVFVPSAVSRRAAPARGVAVDDTRGETSRPRPPPAGAAAAVQGLTFGRRPAGAGKAGGAASGRREWSCGGPPQRPRRPRPGRRGGWASRSARRHGGAARLFDAAG